MKYFLSPQLDLYKNIALKFPDHGSVIDWGCGNGAGTIQFSGPYDGGTRYRVPAGTDIDVDAIRSAVDMWGHLAVFHHVSGHYFSPTTRYDLVVCVEVIEHCEFPGDLMRELQDLVAPGGTLVLSTKNRDAGYRKNNEHEKEFNLIEFREFISQELDGSAFLYDYTLETPCEEHITPMVCVWTKES
jgi:2-polyprenyl-3-methyl-5-hydroxy-6-metoxy-1,4-benzoquinol methylase